MYKYDEFDAAIVRDRIDQFRGQIRRRLAGEISEDDFKPLRLMNGVYLQLHSYMLRIAIPYGQMNSEQLECLAHIADTYDKGYGHITTRQNIQFNWPRLVDIPEILECLANVEMHAIQTSGNCIRNVTTDQFAGAAADEIEDPRPWCELIRQWSTLHPEFSYLPRKFKIAVSGSRGDRAAIRLHDIGLQIRKNDQGEIGFEVIVGGGQGRTPKIGKTVRDFLPAENLLDYLEAIMRVYNLHGRRDNKYKARIKILVSESGLEAFRQDVEKEWQQTHTTSSNADLVSKEIGRLRAFFSSPLLDIDVVENDDLKMRRAEYPEFDLWCENNLRDHKLSSHASITISLKPVGGVPGDISSEQMRKVASLARVYGYNDVRATHEQNLVLPHVSRKDLFNVWRELKTVGLDTPNIGFISDIIACPGLDYCNLANTRSIPIAQAIANKFSDLALQQELGELKIKISGCINACGHHHVGHIGILGVDRKGEEFYQISLGGSADENAEIGSITGPGFSADEVPDAIGRIIQTYLDVRESKSERFIDTLNRTGPEIFHEAIYAYQS